VAFVAIDKSVNVMNFPTFHIPFSETLIDLAEQNGSSVNFPYDLITISFLLIIYLLK
jgi:hypothetical protein